MEAQPVEEKKGFKGMFRKKEQQKEEIPVPQPPKEEPQEQLSKEDIQVNNILIHMQRSQESLDLARQEFINYLKNA